MQTFSFAASSIDSIRNRQKTQQVLPSCIHLSLLLLEVALAFLQRTHLIHCIGPKTYVLGQFGPFRYCAKVDAKLAELAPLTPKFAKRSCFEFFRNERT
jgi:hypothetical protein